MTENDILDDTWAGEIFERARTSHTEPHWNPDAVGAIRLGNRRRRLNRVATAATAVVVAGVVTTQFTTFDKWGSDTTPTASGGATHSTAPGPKAPDTPPGPPPGSKPASELAKYLQISPAGGLPLSQSSAQTLDILVTALDPTGAHLRQNLLPKYQVTRGISKGPGETADAISAFGLWTPDGDIVKALSGKNPGTVPYGQVSITMLLHALPNSSVPDCGYVNLPSPDGYAESAHVAWTPCDVRHLQDGSKVITAHTTNLGDRQAITSTRVYHDGRAIRVLVINWVQYETINGLPEQLVLGSSSSQIDGTPIRPVPWTDQQLSDALSASTVKAE